MIDVKGSCMIGKRSRDVWRCFGGIRDYFLPEPGLSRSGACEYLERLLLNVRDNFIRRRMVLIQTGIIQTQSIGRYRHGSGFDIVLDSC